MGSINPEELARICEGLQLDDQDGLVVRIDKEKLVDGITKLDLFLMGKVLGNNLVNKDTLEEVIRLVWKMSYLVRVKAKGVIIFLPSIVVVRRIDNKFTWVIHGFSINS